MKCVSKVSKLDITFLLLHLLSAEYFVGSNRSTYLFYDVLKQDTYLRELELLFWHYISSFERQIFDMMKSQVSFVVLQLADVSVKKLQN